MGLALQYQHGQTPLDEDEMEGLLIPTITTREELDEFEQLNIERAIEWTLRKNLKKERITNETFIKELHSKMYGDVWKWAGEFRRTNKNIGVDKWQIDSSLKYLLDDCNYWIDNGTYAADEIAIRFKHRLVSIHCFPNGNGRHSRLMADIIAEKVFSRPVFTWGANLKNQNDARTVYIKALKLADYEADYGPLLIFARS